MVTESSIPEELLGEILNYHFWQDPKLFCAIHHHTGKRLTDPTPPLTYTKGTSRADVLLVCKRWLRVGTPLLYHSVRLWTPTQVQDFLILLRSNPYIGQVIRQLRVESVGEVWFEEISKFAPNVHTLCLSFHISLGAPVAAIVRAFSKFDPIHVVLNTRFSPRLTAAEDVTETIMGLMAEWTKMVCSYTKLRISH